MILTPPTCLEGGTLANLHPGLRISPARPGYRLNLTTSSLGRSVDGVTTPPLKATARAPISMGARPQLPCEGSTEPCTRFKYPAELKRVHG